MESNDKLNGLLNKATSSVIEEIKLSDSEKRLMKHYQLKVIAYKKFAERAFNGGLSELSHTEFDEYCYKDLEKKNELLRIENKLQTRLHNKAKLQHEFVANLNQCTNALSDTASYLDGRIAGSDERKVIMARSGGTKQASKYRPLIELAVKLVTEKIPPYKSRRNAALSIEDKIISAGKTLSQPVIISKMQAETTITGWLKKAGLLPPKLRGKKYPVR